MEVTQGCRLGDGENVDAFLPDETEVKLSELHGKDAEKTLVEGGFRVEVPLLALQVS